MNRMSLGIVGSSLAFAAFFTGCGTDSTGPAEQDLRIRFGLETLPPVHHPADNPALPDRIALGRLLFFDPILSGPKDVACATCHHPNFAWADSRQLAVGVSGVGLGPERALLDPNFNLVPRNSPTILNTAFNGLTSHGMDYDPAEAFMFWDGRVKNLETQATKPIASRVEMRGDVYAEVDAFDSVLARLRSIPKYESLFRAAFIAEGDSVNAGLIPSAINASTYGRAIAVFERAIAGANSPYDRYVNGDDKALSESQKRGLELFFTKGNCIACHGGPMLSDYTFRCQGVLQFGPGKSVPGKDFGRWEKTQDEADRWAFRTPTLRNVELTAPYMHDGALATLEDVVEFYDRGCGDDPTIPLSRMDPALFKLHLTAQEKADLVAFMKALTDPGPQISVPESVPSGLAPPR